MCVLSKHNVKLSSYHGGNLVVNSIRRLIRRGSTTFFEISDYLTSMNNENKVGNTNDNISNDEIFTM